MDILQFLGNIKGTQGVQGAPGLPGVNAVPADLAVAGYIATTGTSATKTALRRPFDVKDYGATGDGIVDDTTFVNAAITAATAAGAFGTGVVYFPAGTYKITTGILIDASKVCLRGDQAGGKSTLNFSAIVSGPVLTVGTASNVTNNVQPYYQAKTVLQDLQLVGNGGTGLGNRNATTFGVYVHEAGTSSANAGPSHLAFRNLGIRNFGSGVEIGNHAYGLSFDNVDISECNTCVHAGPSIVDAGERITFSNSTLFNSNIGVKTENPNGSILLNFTSVDYCNTWLQAVNSVITVVGGHFERKTDNTLHGGATPIIISGGNGAVRMSSVTMLLVGTFSSATAPTVIVDNTSGGLAGTTDYGNRSWFRQITATNLQTASGAFASGTGNTVLELATNGVANGYFERVTDSNTLLADPDCEATTILDNWYVSQDSAAITNQFTGTSVNVSKSTANPKAGTRSIKVTKSAAYGGGTAVELAVPITPGSIPFVSFYVSKLAGAGMVGNVYMPIYFANMRSNSSGIPTIGYSLRASSSDNTTALTSAALPYTKITIGTLHRRAPMWATHVVLRFNFDPAVTAGDLFVDDINVTVA